MNYSEVLDYNPLSGDLTWKVSTGRRIKSGDIAGYIEQDGYRRVRYRGKTIAAHRLAWYLYHNMWPNKLIDHINGQKDDNRIKNLREASVGENSRNSKMQKNNKSGFKGVSFNYNKWVACLNGKYLGRFDTPEEASVVYEAAAKQQNGEFYFDQLRLD